MMLRVFNVRGFKLYIYALDSIKSGSYWVTMNKNLEYLFFRNRNSETGQKHYLNRNWFNWQELLHMFLIVSFFTMIFRIFRVLLISYGCNRFDFDLRLKTALVSYVGFIALCKASKSSIAATIAISIKSKNPRFWFPNILFLNLCFFGCLLFLLLYSDSHSSGRIIIQNEKYLSQEIQQAFTYTWHNCIHITYMPHIICYI